LALESAAGKGNGRGEGEGAALAEATGLLGARALALGAAPTGRATLAAPARLASGTVEGGSASRRAASAVFGATADARLSSGLIACGGALGRNANATINAKITANAAAPNTQLSGTAALSLVRSLNGGTLSRARSRSSVTAGELLRLERTRNSLSLGGAEAISCGVQSVEGCALRLASGSRRVDALRKSNVSSWTSSGTASSSAWI
jgi:hypothetical protein